MTERTLGPYRLGRELGSGGMGTVYLAVVEGRAPGLEAGTTVALKVVHPHLFETPGFFKRFLREAEIGKAVRHENVVRTFDVDAVASDGAQHHYLVMEYVEGQTLRALLAEFDGVPEDLCRHVGREVAKGLAAIHAVGVVHRDLKPENVLITADRHTVKVMDLGVAHLADETLRLSQTGAFLGSVEYAAPEQFGGGEVGAAADLHALGVVLYELATGKHPYRADDFRAVMKRVIAERPRRPAEINPQLSPFFEELVLQLLEKDPARRIASAADLARILDDGEGSSWWREKAKAIRAATKRPIRRIRIPRDTALYGREAEIARLRSLYEKSKGGDGQVLLVEGEAGIGKSRLLDEFVGALEREGEDLNFLWGSYPPGGAATASGAFSTAYREHFGSEALEETLSGYLVETPILAPGFAALLRGEPTPEGAQPLTKDSLQTVFVHATRALARERTTIVLVEDLHFAPAEGLALFASLALATPGHRVLLVGTARPGMDEPWLAQIQRVGLVRMGLARLGPKDLVRLLVDAFHSERLAEEIGIRIAAKSDGNPFFVFEIIRGLREGQFISRRDDGTWITTRVIEEIQIPSSVLDLVNARVADLSPEERDLLDVASCCGFEFDPALVAAATGALLLPTLKRFAAIEKCHRLVRACGRRLVFDHHQVQEALYGGLYEQTREAYHAAIAGALEAQAGAAATAPGDLPGALCVDLAEHFLNGAQGARALRYLDAALAHLTRGHLHDAAIRLAGRALAVPGLVAGRDRALLLLERAHGLDVRARRSEENECLAEALSLAEALADDALRTRACWRMADHLQKTGRYEDAERLAGDALALARAIGDRAEEARSRGILGTVRARRERFAEAEADDQACLAISRETGDLRGEASALGSLATIAIALNRYDVAKSLAEHQFAIVQQTGDRGLEAQAAYSLGIAYDTLGRHEEAQRLLEGSLAAARAVGDRLGEALASGSLAIVAYGRNRLEEVRVWGERHLALCREIGYRRGETFARVNLGVASRGLGRLGDALGQFRQCVEVSREIGLRGQEAIGRANLGSLLVTLGARDAALSECEATIALSREVGDRFPEGFALFALASLADERGDVAEAERREDEALALAPQHAFGRGQALVLRARGHRLARAGLADRARADLLEAIAVARRVEAEDLAVAALADLASLPGGAGAEAAAALAESEARLGVEARMFARYHLWRATGEPAHLAEARRLLDLLVEHAPPEYCESMLANVRLHREIRQGAR